jgi:hypothetical protein
MKILLSIPMALLVAAIPAFGQTGFLNLDFESAQPVPDPTYGQPYIIATGNALPGWQAFNGTNPLSDVFYNSGYWVELVGGTNSLVVDGNYSVSLSAGSISQTAQVPTGAESLLFRAVIVRSPVPSILHVTLDGQDLAYTAVSSGTTASGLGYSTYAADISVFAGQVDTLMFSGDIGALDDIQFSSSPVPESSPLWLLFLGSGVLIYYHRRGQPVRS